MEIKELLEMQKSLDNLIFKNSNITEYPINKVKLALLVELSELANEVQSFKYWKHNKNIKRENILEEWADCLHFALSLENRCKVFEKYIEAENLEEFKNKCEEELEEWDTTEDEENDFIFLQTFNLLNRNDTSPLAHILILGYKLNITPTEMEEAYKSKYQKNIQRQKNNY